MDPGKQSPMVCPGRQESLLMDNRCEARNNSCKSDSLQMSHSQSAMGTIYGQVFKTLNSGGVLRYEFGHPFTTSMHCIYKAYFQLTDYAVIGAKTAATIHAEPMSLGWNPNSALWCRCWFLRSHRESDWCLKTPQPKGLHFSFGVWCWFSRRKIATEDPQSCLSSCSF